MPPKFTALRGAEGGSSGYYLKDFTVNDAIEDSKRLQSELRQARNDRASAIGQLNAKIAELEDVRRGIEVTIREYDQHFLKLKAKVAKWKHRAAKLQEKVRQFQGDED